MRERGRLLVVSHPAALAGNQVVYRRLRELGWDVRIVVPSHWRHALHAGLLPAQRLPELADAVLPLRVALTGRPQRHFYLARTVRLIRKLRPDVIFVEEEPFSVSALQWSLAARRAKVPFGLHAWENLDRRLPLPARAIRRIVLPRASFVAARSPAAAAILRRLVKDDRIHVTPHGVAEWPASPARTNGVFTIGFAGRLVPEKGVRELLAAAAQLEGSRLLLVGDGSLRDEATAQAGVEVRTGVQQADMPEVYAEMDVLVLPSRTTARWAEQFGRVLVEALWCGVPVIGSDSGEIPWVVDTTGGGLVVPEGDIPALTAALQKLRDEPHLREQFATQGRTAVRERFSVTASADALDVLLRGATA